MYQNISNVSFSRLEMTICGRRKQYSSVEEMQDFLTINFPRLNHGVDYLLCPEWVVVLNRVFGETDWHSGVARHDSTWNKWYSGSKTYPEFGVRVFGTPLKGDAYYASNGSIRWEKYALPQ